VRFPNGLRDRGVLHEEDKVTQEPRQVRGGRSRQGAGWQIRRGECAAKQSTNSGRKAVAKCWRTVARPGV